MKQTDFEKARLLEVDLVKANVFGVLFMFVSALIYGLPFFLAHGFSFREMMLFKIVKQDHAVLASVLPLLVLLLGIIVHELLHGLTWACFARRGFRSIRFGVLWKMMAPYCHCIEPLRVKHYRLGALMPALVLGAVPAFCGIWTGIPEILLFGWFFTGAAAGDLMILYLLRKENRETLAMDHPTKAGCWVFDK